MKKILYINGNPQKKELSFSRRVGEYFLEQLKKSDSSAEVEVLDLYDTDITLIDEEVLDAWGKLGGGAEFSSLSESQQAKVGHMSGVLNQFKAADEYVIASPFWNFSITPKLKAYVDNLLIAGETFQYTENGPVGLLEGKKATVIQASGGFYHDGPGAALNFNSKYLETVLGFIGVQDVQSLQIGGLAYPDKSPEEKIEGAFRQVDELFAAEPA